MTVLAGAVAFLKPSVSTVSSQLPSLALIGALDASATTLYTVATTEGLLAVVAVVSSLYPVATLILARIFLGERVRRIQGAGICAALAGVLLIAAG